MHHVGRGIVCALSKTPKRVLNATAFLMGSRYLVEIDQLEGFRTTTKYRWQIRRKARREAAKSLGCRPRRIKLSVSVGATSVAS